MSYDPKIGVDVGGVICRADTDAGTTDDAMWMEVPDAFAALRALTEHGCEIWLISKCFENQQKRTRRWLEKTKFYERTGVDPARVLFCTVREHKAIIGRGLDLSAFVDDNVECLMPFVDVWGPSPRAILFHFGVEAVDFDARLIRALPTWADVARTGRLGPFGAAEVQP